MATMTMPTQHERERQLAREVSRTVESALPGVEVLALELTGSDRFCVFVDHPQGVDHALCERVTRSLDRFLDEFTVEVSSPGFDRPLRTRAHFERAVGRKVKMKTDRRARLRGVVIAAGERAVTIDAGREPLEVPYAEIVRANLLADSGGSIDVQEGEDT
jgi:ribosome maturation factor RimP